MVGPPPDVVTTTSLVPIVPEGVVKVISVSLTFVTLVAAAPPTVTLIVFARFVPVTVTEVPPESKPRAGLKDAITGGTTFVMPSARVTEPPPSVVRTTDLLPAEPAGLTKLISVPLVFTIPVAATPPMATEVVFPRSVPVTMIVRPPVVGALVGVSDVMTGGVT